MIVFDTVLAAVAWLWDNAWWVGPVWIVGAVLLAVLIGRATSRNN